MGRLTRGKSVLKKLAKFGFAALAIATISACYTVPKERDFTLDLQGDYKAVADCAWMTFRTKSDWSRDNLDSMSKVEFSFGNTSATAGRIDIVGVSPNRTQIRSYMPVAAWGKNFWPDKHRPIFEACGSK